MTIQMVLYYSIEVRKHQELLVKATSFKVATYIYVGTLDADTRIYFLLNLERKTFDLQQLLTHGY